MLLIQLSQDDAECVETDKELETELAQPDQIENEA